MPANLLDCETENTNNAQMFFRLMSFHHSKRPNIGWGVVLAALTCQLATVADAQNPEAVRACQRVADRLSRLDCYDRAFPPIVESIESVESVDRNESLPPRAERVAPVSEPEPEPMARIVEVQTPSVSTTIFLTADGRTFVRENATTVIRWPDPPFDVEIQTGFFGSLYLKLPGRNPRVSVVLRD